MERLNGGLSLPCSGPDMESKTGLNSFIKHSSKNRVKHNELLHYSPLKKITPSEGCALSHHSTNDITLPANEKW